MISFFSKQKQHSRIYWCSISPCFHVILTADIFYILITWQMKRGFHDRRLHEAATRKLLSLNTLIISQINIKSTQKVIFIVKKKFVPITWICWEIICVPGEVYIPQVVRENTLLIWLFVSFLFCEHARTQSPALGIQGYRKEKGGGGGGGGERGLLKVHLTVFPRLKKFSRIFRVYTQRRRSKKNMI